MSDPKDWIDVTAIGDNYQVEMTVDGTQFRHRPFSLAGRSTKRSGDGGSPMMGRAWREGRPPSGFHSLTPGENNGKHILGDIVEK